MMFRISLPANRINAGEGSSKQENKNLGLAQVIGQFPCGAARPPESDMATFVRC